MRVRQKVVRGVLAVLFFLAIVVTMTFLLLPVVAIFVHVPVGRLLHELTNPVVTDALIVSLKTVAVAQVAILLLGTPTAYFFASRRFRGRPFLVTLIELPIVLPPAVAGIGLIVAFGRFGLLGSSFDALGINVSFNQVAVVFAISFVAGPFYVRQAIASFEAVDRNLISASRTLGAGSPRTFFKVTMPLARGGLVAGEAICLARGLGEFGATIMFAGSLQGVTQTLPLAVYTTFEAQNGLDVALAISALLVIISLAILLALKGSGLWERSRPAVTAIAQPEPR
jgi:molybdate transport system permease protein